MNKSSLTPIKNMNEPKKITTSVKWLTAGMSALMLAYGIFIIANEHYYGYSSKTGAEVNADGSDAVLIGISFIIFGLIPMSLWAKSAKAAGFFAGICMILGIILFLAPAYMH